MSNERAQYDGDELDEIVAYNVTLHIEAMDAHHWMIRAHRDGVEIHLSGSDLIEVEETTGLPVIQRDAIAWCHVWMDSKGREHKCYARPHGEGKKHRCSCGAKAEWSK